MSLLIIPKIGPEISDKIISFDPETLERQPVNKNEILELFRSLNNHSAVRIIQKIEDLNGTFDPDVVDLLLIRVHYEMQQMSEEFQHGQRVAEILRPILNALRKKSIERPIRIVDIGCGTGYVVRWLAAKGNLGNDTELIGADFNVALINEAQRLANIEKLSCSFIVANAFHFSQEAAIYISTGILHHFRGDDLVNLLKQHDRPGTCAFIHFDFQPSVFAPLGSWLFHTIRMREALARHDGVLSAIRAHTGLHLLKAARTGAPNFTSAIYGTRLWGLPIPRAFHSLVGIRPKYHSAFISELGSKAFYLGTVQ
jgi:2-polyprenyl-3-methyl-5-hydroxy-6-metoxy-1,4-benzoquinol methylase